MKNKKHVIVLILLFLMFLSSCVDSSQEALEIDITIEFEMNLTINESRLMKVYSTLDEDTFTFVSSDESIVVVNQNGLVSGISIGQATITVTSTSGKTMDHIITVIPILHVESMLLTLEAQDVYYAGQPYTYAIEFFPEHAIHENVRFSYANPNVMINEKDQTITFIRAGEANIFVYLERDWHIQSEIEIDVAYHRDSNVYDLLFVGNSLTRYTHNIPLMVKQMIEKDGSIVYIDYSTNYQYLDQHQLHIESALNQNQYTHVILQEKSDGLTTDFNRFRQSVLTYHDMIVASGAKTVLYQTWTYDYPDIETKQWMHDIVSQGYKQMAIEIDAWISLVGDAFMEVIINHPEINLYVDLNHPSLYGAYLSALVHYKTITGNNATRSTYRPDGISVEIDAILKSVVDHLIP